MRSSAHGTAFAAEPSERGRSVERQTVHFRATSGLHEPWQALIAIARHGRKPARWPRSMNTPSSRSHPGASARAASYSERLGVRGEFRRVSGSAHGSVHPVCAAFRDLMLWLSRVAEA